jgi:hypothetical protein
VVVRGAALLAIATCIRGSDGFRLSAVRIRCPSLTAQVTESTKPVNGGRGGSERRRLVDERVEDLVIAGRRHPELLADPGVLDARVLPPQLLQPQHRTLVRGQHIVGDCGAGVGHLLRFTGRHGAHGDRPVVVDTPRAFGMTVRIAKAA